MAGRPRKPPNTLQGHRSARALVVIAPNGGPRDVPEPVRGWLVTTKRDWTTFWEEAEPVALVMRADRPAILRWFTYYDEWQRALREFRKDRMIESRMNGRIVNPAFRLVEACEVHMRRFEEKFGFTPLDRLRLGVEFGNAVRSIVDVNRDLDGDGADEAGRPMTLAGLAAMRAAE